MAELDVLIRPFAGTTLDSSAGKGCCSSGDPAWPRTRSVVGTPMDPGGERAGAAAKLGLAPLDAGAGSTMSDAVISPIAAIATAPTTTTTARIDLRFNTSGATATTPF